MKKSLTIPAVILLITAAVAIVLLKGKDPGESSTADSENKRERPEAGRPSSGDAPRSVRSNRPTPQATPSQSREGELVEQYGRERTARAREVSENVVSILDDFVAVGELMMEGGQEFGGGRRGMVNGITRRMGIDLSEDQQSQALALYDEWQKTELEKSKKSLMTLRNDPTAMMELFLAGDAKERGDLDEGGYSAVRDEMAGELSGIINPLDRNNMRADRRMASDENLMKDFAGILDPEQAEKFSSYREEQAASGDENSRAGGAITAMPTMELATLDKAVGGAKKMTTGFRSLIEGMGAMRELRPQIEPGADGGE